MKLKYFGPLLALEIPTVIISTLLFVFDEPPKLSQLVGFVFLNVMFCVHYWMGVRMVIRGTTDRPGGQLPSS